jgi:alanyl-tRNA synthetase
VLAYLNEREAVVKPLAERFKAQPEALGDGAAVVLGGLSEPTDLSKVILVAAFGKTVIAKGPKAGAFIGAVAKACGGGGGGRPQLAQAGGKDGAALDGALEQARAALRVALA